MPEGWVGGGRQLSERENGLVEHNVPRYDDTVGRGVKTEAPFYDELNIQGRHTGENEVLAYDWQWQSCWGSTGNQRRGDEHRTVASRTGPCGAWSCPLSWLGGGSGGR